MCGSVCRVAEPDPKALDELFNRVLDTEDGALTAAREAGIAAGMPAIEVSAQHGKLLFLTRDGDTRHACARDRHTRGIQHHPVGPRRRSWRPVVTLEYEPKHAEVARRNLARAEVDDRVEVIVGAALDTLPTLTERDETFDLIFIDADKENNVAYVEWAIKTRRAGLNHRGGQHRSLRTCPRPGAR